MYFQYFISVRNEKVLIIWNLIDLTSSVSLRNQVLMQFYREFNQILDFLNKNF